MMFDYMYLEDICMKGLWEMYLVSKTFPDGLYAVLAFSFPAHIGFLMQSISH